MDDIESLLQEPINYKTAFDSKNFVEIRKNVNSIENQDRRALT